MWRKAEKVAKEVECRIKAANRYTAENGKLISNTEKIISSKKICTTKKHGSMGANPLFLREITLTKNHIWLSGRNHQKSLDN